MSNIRKPAYIIVYGITAELLVDNVNKYIKEGYEPQGGVSISTEGDQCLLFQAMYMKPCTPQ